MPPSFRPLPMRVGRSPRGAARRGVPRRSPRGSARHRRRSDAAVTAALPDPSHREIADGIELRQRRGRARGPYATEILARKGAPDARRRAATRTTILPARPIRDDSEHRSCFRPELHARATAFLAAWPLGTTIPLGLSVLHPKPPSPPRRREAPGAFPVACDAF